MRKVYIVLFICCVIRVVYLELVEDLFIEIFKWCLRRFIVRRGVLVLMVLDNVKIFKGIDKELCIFYGYLLVREELDNWRI